MTVTVYRSTDASAPQLSGTAGSLAAILDGCLVTGYGSKPAAGWTTAFTSGDLRSYRQGIFSVVGVIPGLGGTWTISGNHQNSFAAGSLVYILGDTGGGDGTYTIVSATDNGANTDIVIVETIPGGAAGDGTLRPNNGFYLGVDDSGTLNARIRGFETMSAAGVSVASGTGPFPTDAQFSGGLYIRKSTAADANPRAWTIVANDRVFYFWKNIFNNFSDINYSKGTFGSSVYMSTTFFGDIITQVPNDAFHTMILGESTPPFSNYFSHNGTNYSSPITGHYIARNYTQAGASQPAVKHGWNFLAQDTSFGGTGSGTSIPEFASGKIPFFQIYIGALIGDSGLRGFMPAMWAGPAARIMQQQGAQVSFTPSNPTAYKLLDGRTLETFLDGGQVFIEISDTWYT